MAAKTFNGRKVKIFATASQLVAELFCYENRNRLRNVVALFFHFGFYR